MTHTTSELIAAGWIEETKGNWRRPNSPSSTPSEGSECLKRANPALLAINPEHSKGVSREIKDLHNPIIAWCRSQVPAVPYIHARTDKASSMTEGAPDFVICYHGRVLLIELKTGAGKLSKEQVIWHHLASSQGIEVKVLRSMAEFHELIETLTPQPKE